MFHSSPQELPARGRALSFGGGKLFLLFFLFLLVGIPASFVLEVLRNNGTQKVEYWIESSNQTYVPYGALKSVRQKAERQQRHNKIPDGSTVLVQPVRKPTP